MAISCFCDHCGAENAPSETICCACQKPLTLHAGTTGTLLNERYEILNEVGAGGFGAVYKARDTREGKRLVAVKQINLQGLSPQEIIEATDAFNREAEILTMLSHPLLPTIFDRFSDPEHWYLVMTYIDGTTPDEYLQHHHASGLHTTPGLPLSETLEIALRLCDALHYLHTQQPPVIFRDLKPGNIMRTRKGQLYLIDFGIARRFKPGQAKDTIPFGSPGFAAPEQYGRAQTTPQADIYSLGALLYCLLTGDDPSEHPFDFAPLPYPTIEGMRELNALIQRMVAIDPLQRPADILEVQADLKGIQQLNAWSNQQHRLWTPPPSQTPPPGGSGQQQVFLNSAGNAKPQKRKISRRAAITVGLILGGLVAIEGYSLWQTLNPALTSTPDSNWPDTIPTMDAQNQATQTQDQATATQTVQTSTPTEQTSNVFQGSPTFWSPDLTHAAVLNATNNTIDFYLNQGQQPFGSIQPTSFNPSDLVIQWSPNNQQIILFSDEANSDVWSVNDQKKLFSIPTSAIVTEPTMAWSPRGNYLAATYQDQNGSWVVSLLNAQNGHGIWHQSLATRQPVSCLAWSPDSRYFVFPRLNNSSWTLEIWDSLTLSRVQVVSNANDQDFFPGSTILNIAWSLSGQQIAFALQPVGAPVQLWLANLGKMNGGVMLTQVSSSFSCDSGLALSPNAKLIADLVFDNLYVWDMSSGELTFTTYTDDSDNNRIFMAFTWLPDSRSILTVDDNNTVARWSIG